MKTTSYEIDMTHGSILSGMIRFALPLAASSVLQLLFNAADVIVIGRFSSSTSLAAVGADGLLTGLFANIFLNLAVGTTVAASKSLGSGEKDKVKKLSSSSMAFSVLIGVFFMAVMYAAGKPLLILLRTPEEVMPAALSYLYFYLAGLPGVAVYNFGAAVLRAKGDTRRPFFFLLVSGILNVFMNLFFVLVCGMDVAGVALATTISQYAATGLMVACLVREKDEFRLDKEAFRIDRKALNAVLKIGVPTAFQCLIFYISNFVIQAAVNSFGAVTMAGNAAASNIEMFVWVCMSGFEQAGMTYISRNLGARDLKRIDRSNAVSIICTAVTGTVLGLTVVLFSHSLMHIYTSDESAVAQGMIRIRLICGLYALCGIMDAVASNTRGLGYSVLPSIVTVFGACILRIVWIFTVFSVPQYHTLECLFTAYPGSWAVTALILAVCYVVVRRRTGKSFESRGDAA
jgi:putative MATE family efflux protein